MDTLTIRKPDDWHAHLRDGAMLKAVLPFHTKRFRRAIVMPNLSPHPVITTADVKAYQERIVAQLDDALFTPLMTYYMTEQSSPSEIAQGFKDGVAIAVKLYPANATTNSALGVTDITQVYPVLEAMQNVGMPILLHGETVIKDGVTIEPIDREKVFLDSTLPTLLKNFPALKIVLEHATTKNAVDFVRNENSPRLASTITVHHLLVTDEEVSHAEEPAYLTCMPIIKSVEDRKALRDAATSGDSHFFLGTDSAPHPVSAKQKTPPAAGVFTAPAALELYAEVFDEEGKIENFESFASLNGPAFYGLAPNEEKITLVKKDWLVDSLVTVENGETMRPFRYSAPPQKSNTISWAIA